MSYNTNEARTHFAYIILSIGEFMGLFGKFFKKAIDKEVAQKIHILKERIKQELEEEVPDPSAYLQGWQAQDEKQGKDTRVNYKTLESLYTRESWVRAAIDVIARTTTKGGYRFVDINEDEDSSEYRSTPENDEVVKLFEAPNSENSFDEIIERIVVDLHIYGDAYLELVRNKDEKVKAIYNVYAPSMRVLIDKHGIVQGYLQKLEYSSQSVVFAERDVVHFKLNNPGNEVYGLSPLESLFIPIESDLYAQAYNRDFFKNNATPRLHVDMGNCTYAQLKRNRHYWNTEVKGSGNAHKTIITEGGAKINPIGTPPKDMEFLNQRKFSRDEILAVFGVPPIKVGIYEDANRANADEQDKTFKAEKILPLQKNIARKINRRILDSMDNVSIKFEFNLIDLRDASDQAEIDEVHLNTGLRTINELRRRDGLKPVAWGDTPILNQRMAPLSGAEEDKEEDR